MMRCIEIVSEFWQGHWLTICTLVAWMAVFILCYRASRRDIIFKMILAFVTEAEQTLGSGTGTLKYASVIQKIEEKMPKLAKIFFTANELEAMIETAVEQLKLLLQRGIDINGYEHECLTKETTNKNMSNKNSSLNNSSELIN